MYKVSVMYPNRAGARFDFAYYAAAHMDLVRRLLEPFGLVRTEVLKGLSGGGDQPAPYICIGNLYFETAEGYETGVAASAARCPTSRTSPISLRFVRPAKSLHRGSTPPPSMTRPVTATMPFC